MRDAALLRSPLGEHAGGVGVGVGALGVGVSVGVSVGVGICGVDLLITASALRGILNIIDGNGDIPDYPECAFVCGRYRLPLDWVSEQPTIEQ